MSGMHAFFIFVPVFVLDGMTTLSNFVLDGMTTLCAEITQIVQ
jgi:hypothetical protein